MSEKDFCGQLTPNNTESGKKRFPKSKQKISFYSHHVYPPAASVTPRSERMNLSSGQANISRKTDCWMTYEEYCDLTRYYTDFLSVFLQIGSLISNQCFSQL